jgi:hypothetical protein
MKLVTDYLERAAHFEQRAAKETDPKFKALLKKNAEDYFKLAEKRAKEAGEPIPKRPTQQ